MNEIEKLFRKIQKKDALLIRDALQKLFARDFKSLNVKKLKGSSGVFRIRIGDYRIIYFDDGEVIKLQTIKKRSESTYKKF